MMNQKISYTLEEAAKQVGCSVRILRQAISSGNLRPRYAGEEALIRHEDLANWVDQLPAKPTTAENANEPAPLESATKEEPKPKAPRQAEAPQLTLPERESEWLTPEDLGRAWQLSPGTLSNWRTSPGKGPDFIRIGGLVRYHRDAVAAWLEKQPTE